LSLPSQQCHQQLQQLQQQQMDASAAQKHYQQQQEHAQGADNNSTSPADPSNCCQQQLSPQQQAQLQQPSCPDVTWSGCSALLVALDQERSKLFVASAGVCKAVLARRSEAGHLTVMELAPRLGLGHDPQNRTPGRRRQQHLLRQQQPPRQDQVPGSAHLGSIALQQRSRPAYRRRSRADAAAGGSAGQPLMARSCRA